MAQSGVSSSGSDLLERLFGGTPPEALGARASDLALAAEAALRGGGAALRHYGDRELRVRHKRGHGPVTAADHASNRSILEVLSERRPGDRLLSEESERGRPGPADASRLWVVDPLDGTKEFLARNGEFSAMVGLAEEGVCVLGAVYQPVSDRLHLGVAAAGAWAVEGARERPRARGLRLPGRNGPRSGASAEPERIRSTGSERIRFVRSRSHAGARLDRLQEALGEIEIILSGSVGIKCALIADGRADLYVHPVPYLKEWDTCAPEALLLGAGGRVTDCATGRLTYGKDDPRQQGGIFAGRANVWERVAPLVRELARPPFSDS